MTTYQVAVPKAYFARDQWPADKFTSYLAVYRISAANRTAAAKAAWAKHGAKLAARMLPTVRRVSLAVNEPSAGVGGLLGRLEMVTVVK